MSFPKLKNKYLFEALFSPDEFVSYKNWDKANFPSKIIITYQKTAVNHFRKMFAGDYRTIRLTGYHKLLVYKNIGFIKLDGIGSPHAATAFEELISMGGRTFINMGSAGGLTARGVFLCNKAVRDEGTSHHYIKDSLYSYPDKELTNRLKQSLEKFKLSFKTAPTWTIDAPYRETKKEISHYRKLGIATVEMEASALFAVAKLRNVKLAAVFVVSDLLAKDAWVPEFHKFNYKKALTKVLDAAVACLLAED
ncbi:MAG TPA: nucleoside phosphorylase [Candidatus Nanoarchaeia archaeon]|nr:nucleoside phosphorylase [Candidatus Nanoarchaeia archaeon]